MKLESAPQGTLLVMMLGVTTASCGDAADGTAAETTSTSAQNSAGGASSSAVASTGAGAGTTSAVAAVGPTSAVSTTGSTAGGATGMGGATSVVTATNGGMGGSTSAGGASVGGAGGTGAVSGTGGGSTTGATTHGPDIDGSCTESSPENSNRSGSGPHEVVVETNSDSGINEGTIFRPADLGGGEAYPILVWGEGGCSQDGNSNAASMAEIASYGYFVVADGTPNGGGSRSQTSDTVGMAAPLIAYIDWVIDENHKPCSAYYHAIDTNKVAANGFSCGGLMSTGTAGDPRITTWGSTSSGTFSVDQALYDSVHTPVLIIAGGPSDIAYENGLRDYDNISALGIPIMWFSKDIGHGGDLFQGGGGDFTKIHLAWLNWRLKGDEGATGKGVLVGASCSYCTDSEWEVRSANIE